MEWALVPAEPATVGAVVAAHEASGAAATMVLLPLIRETYPDLDLHLRETQTQKLVDDAAIDIEAWLSGKIADIFSRKENTAFVSGNGVGQPRGILTYEY